MSCTFFFFSQHLHFLNRRQYCGSKAIWHWLFSIFFFSTWDQYFLSCVFFAGFYILTVRFDCSAHGQSTSKVIARTLEYLHASMTKGAYWNEHLFTSITSLMGTDLEGKNLLSEESKFFPLRAVPSGMVKQYIKIRWILLNLYYFHAYIYAWQHTVLCIDIYMYLHSSATDSCPAEVSEMVKRIWHWDSNGRLNF